MELNILEESASMIVIHKKVRNYKKLMNIEISFVSLPFQDIFSTYVKIFSRSISKSMVKMIEEKQ